MHRHLLVERISHVGLCVAALLAAACNKADSPARAPVDGGTQPTTPATSDANVVVRVRGTVAPYAHEDAWSALTPRDETVGVQALVLARGDDDAEPLVVFDRGAEYVEAKLAEGADTVVGELPASSLKPGVYTQARLVVSHKRFKVDATFHAPSAVSPGEFERLLVFADGVQVEGKRRATGYHRSTFRAGGVDFGTHEGVSEVPAAVSRAIPLEVKDKRAAYVLPVSVEIPERFERDATFVVVEANVDRCFRWEDRAAENYKTGVWDIEEEFFEAVRQSGPNSLTVRLE